MTVSIVICAYTLERWRALARAVASCRAQTRSPDEVVVVIDHNDDLLARAVDELEGARVLANAGTRGLSGARNTGVAATTGDVVVFLDDDAHADPDWLEHLLAPLVDPRVAGVGGWIVPEWEAGETTWFPESFYWIVGCSYLGLPETGATIRNPIGASMALRRSVFTSVGGFTDGIGRIGKVPLGCEETELCIRYTAAHPDERFVLTHAAVVHHLVPPSRTSWHYFRTRCWAEGLSKAAVSSLVGARSGLSSERSHVMRALPTDAFRSLKRLGRDPRASLTTMLLIVVGTCIAAAGLVRGRVALRRTPIRPVAAPPLAAATEAGTDRPEPFPAQTTG